MSDSTLPTHPRTGLTAVGFRRNGAPIWPILGGSEDGGDPPAGDGQENPPAGDQPPADPPKTYTQADIDKAVEARLARERSKFKDYDDIKAKAARLDELEQANASDLEKAVKAAQDETRAAVVREYGQKLAAGILKAELSQRMKPADADALISDLNLGKFVTDDGDVDSDALKAVIDRVAPKGQADLGQGSRGGQAKPKSLNEAIANHYTPARS
jgi:hypothetical protein